MKKLFEIEKDYWHSGKNYGPGVPGCLSVNVNNERTGKTCVFLIDTPERTGEDSYNCHVDGCDYEFATLGECVAWGFYVRGWKFND